MSLLKRVSILVPLLITAILTGCGGDDEEVTRTETKPPAAGGQRTTVDLDEYSFKPGNLVVERRATINARNVGAIGHNLTIERGPDPKKESKKLAGTSTFSGGASEELRVDLDPGKYAMVCTVPGHRELGMVGTIAVK